MKLTILVLVVLNLLSIATIREERLHLRNGETVKLIVPTAECNENFDASNDPDYSVWATSPWGVQFSVESVECAVIL